MLKKITKWETEDGTVFDTQEEAEDYMFEQDKEVMVHSTEQERGSAPSAPVPQQDVEKLRAELAEEVEATDNWRRLALQFDGHRMQAIGHLKAMLTDPQGSEANALAFIKAPPLHGDAVLAQRIAAIAAAPQSPEAAPVQLPEPSVVVICELEKAPYISSVFGISYGANNLYTEQQVMDLLKSQGIYVKTSK